MSILWQEQVCLLTGASGGIGAAIANQLANLGVSLILVGRNEDKLTALAQSLPGQHSVVGADITTAEGIEKVFEGCRDRQLTMLVNNAGITTVGDFQRIDSHDLQAVIATNLSAPMLLTQRLLPLLRQAKTAHIINVGSTFGSIGFPCHAVYCASKFGLRGWSEALAREYANSNINIYYLAPRATQTEINSTQVVSMNRELGNQMDTPDAVAVALVQQVEKKQPRRFLGFPEKLFARINGIMPGVVDRALVKKLPTIQKHMTTVHEEKLS